MPYRSEAVSDEIRARADEWLARFRHEALRLGLPFEEPWRIEHLYEDAIDLEWNGPARWFHVTVWNLEDGLEGIVIDYLRAETRSPTCEMLEGTCAALEVCRLLWHWYLGDEKGVSEEHAL